MERLGNALLMTEFDHRRLEQFLELLRDRFESENAVALQEELDRASVVSPMEIPPDVVTMNSRVELLDIDSGRRRSVALVFPGTSAAGAGRTSVLAPVGRALLGSRQGDTVELPVPGGMRRFRIEQVSFQPEAEGRFEL